MTHYHIHAGTSHTFVNCRTESLDEAIDNYFDAIRGFIKSDYQAEQVAREEVTDALTTSDEYMSNTSISDCITVAIIPCSDDPCIIPIDN